MSSRSHFKGTHKRRKTRRASKGHTGRRLRFETFEDRRMLSFTPGGSYSLGTTPGEIVAADFNGDGRLDLATANTSDNSVSVLLGNEGGTFQPAKTSAAGANPVSLAVGDFNADGTLDLAAINRSARGVNVMFGNQDGTFAAPTHINAGSNYAASLVSGDFNDDGKMDLVLTSNDRPLTDYGYLFGDVDVMLAVGDGSFTVRSTFSTFERKIGLAIATDFNSDGKMDLVTELPDYSTIMVLLGDGNGHLGVNPNAGFIAEFATGPSAAADLNGDLKTDLVSVPGGDNVAVNFGDGDDSFLSQDPEYYTTGWNTFSAILGDFDRDGTFDIAAAIVGTNEVGILRNEGTGTFGAVEHFAVGQSGSPTTSGDFNFDGVIDSADYVAWRKNDGTPEGYNAWRAHFGQSVIPVASPLAVVAGDFNGDGWLDVATSNAEGSVSVLFNDQTWPQVALTLSIGNVEVTEGNTGTTDATFTVTLSRPSNVDVTVHYETKDYDTALAGIDYIAESGTLTIPAGETSGAFTVAIIGDRLAEGNEYFGVELSAPTNATFHKSWASCTIFDDEPQISINYVYKSEGSFGTTPFTFTVTLLSVAYDQPVTVAYRTVDGTATTADHDYVAKTGTLTFSPGQTTKTITIDVKGDNKKESDENFLVELFDNSANSLIVNMTGMDGMGEILNDDLV